MKKLFKLLFWGIYLILRVIYSIPTLLVASGLAYVCFRHADVVAYISKYINIPYPYSEYVFSRKIWVILSVIITYIFLRKCEAIRLRWADKDKSLPQSYWGFLFTWIKHLLGNALASRKIGQCYHLGHGVNCDYSKARYYHEKAAKRGLPSAKAYLGRAYIHGWGTIPDINYGLKCLEALARRGNEDALIYIWKFCNFEHMRFPNEWLANARLSDRQLRWAKYRDKYKKPLEAHIFNIGRYYCYSSNVNRSEELIEYANKNNSEAIKYLLEKDRKLPVDNKHLTDEERKRFKDKLDELERKDKQLAEDNRMASIMIAERIPTWFNSGGLQEIINRNEEAIAGLAAYQASFENDRNYESEEASYGYDDSEDFEDSDDSEDY